MQIRTKQILERLRVWPCRDEIEARQRDALAQQIESEFAGELFGTTIDEHGGAFGYVIAKNAYLPELSGGPLSGVFVTRLTGDEAVFRAYLRHQPEGVMVLDEKEKELCFHNIEAALLLGESKRKR